ncbi:peptide/nickel transport system ATP-binding protein [Limimaricola soesokkakensis]|uniref:Oligopeptide transport ATP-binding protein OppF n=1 Tax=Limimaricola soesokkakensis TaxID=1343159 RepID=A0A1X6ZBP9_9RHOB|nr:oligopeptide/dipeptide ABC transporter ATP-binding protein [Limimaricola soesokkakensis]PSK86501.1 peptide/nickel transport system ATP-binding protein [Limimaricola soesokkakensis]SLN44903.1 Oligopeptide transport ATP-binding protein OppF [Limimaricola soesokkakensis]
MSDAPVLELRNVTKTYTVKQGMFGEPKPLTAINDVSLKLGRGEVLGLVGESGCGKSTLAKVLLGLEAPSSGEVLVDGERLDGQDRRKLARRIQPIFQDPYSSLNPRKSIADIVSLPLRVHKVGDAASRDRAVREILDIVGLPARVMNTYPSQMSGGQRQRVAIARALIMKPEIVICDEPTSALDVSVQSQILNLLGDLRQEFGLTYLFISHNLAVVEHLATRVAVMYLGRIVEEASVGELFDTPRHPYSVALLSSVLTPEPGRGVPDTQLGAVFPNPIDPPSGCHFHPRCARAMPHCAQVAPRPLPTPEGHVECHLYDDSRGRAVA